MNVNETFYYGSISSNIVKKILLNMRIHYKKIIITFLEGVNLDITFHKMEFNFSIVNFPFYVAIYLYHLHMELFFFLTDLIRKGHALRIINF